MTDSEFDSNLAGWSPDGRELFLTANRVAEPYYDAADTDLYRVPADAKEAAPVRMVSIDGQIGAIEVSPDGKQVAFGGGLNTKPVRSYNQPDLFVAPLAAAGRCQARRRILPPRRTSPTSSTSTSAAPHRRSARAARRPPCVAGVAATRIAS